LKSNCQLTSVSLFGAAFSRGSTVTFDHDLFIVLQIAMTRFAAYSSESSSDEEEAKPRTPIVSHKGRSHILSGDADEEDAEGSDSEGSESSSSSGSEPSDMQEDELMVSPPRPHRMPRAKDRNALVEDANGEMRYAHEIDKRVSPGSVSSRSSPGSRAPGPRGDPTIIPWAHQIGVDSQRMHVMQASLFRSPEEAAALKAMSQSVKPKAPAIRLETDARTASRKHRRDSDGDAVRYDSREVSEYN
jgi:nuclear pore complex protein Nup98-Nup96